MADEMVTKISGKPRDVVGSVQNVLNTWHSLGIIASPLQILVGKIGEVIVVMSPFAKANTPKEYFRASNNYANFIRGKLFNNSGLKIAITDSFGNEWYFGTTNNPKPLYKELPE
jgi:hypothetical protein